MEEVSLVQLMRGEFTTAKLYRNVAGVFYVAVVALGIVNTLLAANQVGFLWLPFIIAVLGFLAFVSSRLSLSERLKAEKLREMVLYLDSLGVEPSPKKQAHIRASTSVFAQRFAKTADNSPYYESNKLQGAARLLDNLHESMYWTMHIASTAKSVYWTLTVLVLAVGVLALVYAVVAINRQEIGIAVAQAAVTVILFGAAGSPLKDALAFGRLETDCRLLERQTDHLIDQEVDLIEAMQVVYDYGYALRGAPVLPGWIYRLRGEQLNRWWKGRG